MYRTTFLDSHRWMELFDSVRDKFGDWLVDVFRLRVLSANTAGSGPCALARPRSFRYGVGARSDGWNLGVRLGKSAAGMVELGSG
ncbi:hypothetical protein BHE74_00047319 [Ensete ventricosum]|nr:hypothetical protein BHE74_00047319 [Ensete ventricosum]